MAIIDRSWRITGLLKEMFCGFWLGDLRMGEVNRISLILVFAFLMLFVHGSWAQDYRRTCASEAERWLAASKALDSVDPKANSYRQVEGSINEVFQGRGSSVPDLSGGYDYLIGRVRTIQQEMDRNLPIIRVPVYRESVESSLRFDLCKFRVAAEYVRSSGARGDTSVRSSVNQSPPSAPVDAEASANQSLTLAQQNQSRGDEQAKKDGRKRNDSAYEAHNCLTPDDLDNPRSYGSLRNSCGYKVEFHFCVLRPNASSWSTAYDCEKQSFGGGSAGAYGRGPVQIKGAQSVLWFACRSPAIVVDQRYDAGRGGLTGRCRVIGG